LSFSGLLFTVQLSVIVEISNLPTTQPVVARTLNQAPLKASRESNNLPVVPCLKSGPIKSQCQQVATIH
jgi:hypothetical protein